MKGFISETVFAIESSVFFKHLLNDALAGATNHIVSHQIASIL